MIMIKMVVRMVLGMMNDIGGIILMIMVLIIVMMMTIKVPVYTAIMMMRYVLLNYGDNGGNEKKVIDSESR